MSMEHLTNDSPYEYAPSETLYTSTLDGEELNHNLYNTQLHIFLDHPDLNHIEYRDFFNQKIWLIFDSGESIEEMTELGFDSAYHHLKPEYQYVAEAYIQYQNDQLEIYLKGLNDGNATEPN